MINSQLSDVRLVFVPCALPCSRPARLRDKSNVKNVHRIVKHLLKTSEDWTAHNGTIQPTTAQLCRSATKKNVLEDLFSSVLSQFKKYHHSGNLKFDYLGISQS